MEQTLRIWFVNLGFRGSYPKPQMTLAEFWAGALTSDLAFLLVRMAGAEGWPDRQQVIESLDVESGCAGYLIENPCWDADTAEEIEELFDGNQLDWYADELRKLFPAPGPMTDPVGDQPWKLLARAEQQIVELKSRLAELEAENEGLRDQIEKDQIRERLERTEL